jgi:hypothetical protein
MTPLKRVILSCNLGTPENHITETVSSQLVRDLGYRAAVMFFHAEKRMLSDFFSGSGRNNKSSDPASVQKGNFFIAFRSLQNISDFVS